MVIYLCTGIGEGCHWGTKSVRPPSKLLCLCGGDGADDRLALRKHIEQDMPMVMTTLTQSMTPPTNPDMEKEAEAACQCAESWVTYGIGAEYVFVIIEMAKLMIVNCQNYYRISMAFYHYQRHLLPWWRCYRKVSSSLEKAPRS